MIIKGKVIRISQREKSYGIQVKEEGKEPVWLNNFGECPVAEKDEVEAEYETTEEGFKNIKTLKKLAREEISEKSKEDIGSLAVTIVKDSLNEARQILVDFIKNKPDGEELSFTPEDLIEIADQIRKTKLDLKEKFEEYCNCPK